MMDLDKIKAKIAWVEQEKKRGGVLPISYRITDRDRDELIAEIERLKDDRVSLREAHRAELERLTHSNKNLEFNNTGLGKICEKHMQTIKQLKAENENRRSYEDKLIADNVIQGEKIGRLREALYESLVWQQKLLLF